MNDKCEMCEEELTDEEQYDYNNMTYNIILCNSCIDEALEILQEG